MKTICYVRQKSRKHIFTLDKKFSHSTLVVESKLSCAWIDSDLREIIDDLNPNDNLFLADVRDLGRDILDSLDVLSAVYSTSARIGISAIHSSTALRGIKRGILYFSPDIKNARWDILFSQIIETERARRSERTKAALAKKRASGVILGRPLGRRSCGLDQHESALRKQIATGVTQKFLANKYGVTPATISAWMKRNGIKRP
jgi:DNA invertase Pin-like site-specific DNA recombinase